MNNFIELENNLNKTREAYVDALIEYRHAYMDNKVEKYKKMMADGIQLDARYRGKLYPVLNILGRIDLRTYYQINGLDAINMTPNKYIVQIDINGNSKTKIFEASQIQRNYEIPDENIEYEF